MHQYYGNRVEEREDEETRGEKNGEGRAHPHVYYLKAREKIESIQAAVFRVTIAPLLNRIYLMCVCNCVW